jgi:3-(methylthio)propanoyl-CoA dehydrogenase
MADQRRQTIHHQRLRRGAAGAGPLRSGHPRRPRPQLFLVEKGEGVRVRRIEHKLGIHSSPTCEIQFTNAPAKLIGKTKRGLITYVMALMNGARLAIAAQGVGIAEAALQEAADYAAVRRQFGKPIRDIPAVADLLATMTLEVEAGRALVYETARIVDRMRGAALTGDRTRERALDRLAALLTPMAKYYASELSIRVANDAVQILGGSGYMRDYPVERLLRDARITTLYEGTSQLQVVAAIRGVTAGVAEARFAEMAEALASSDFSAMLERLASARIELAAATEAARGTGEGAYLDLVAQSLVDLTCDIYMGYLLVDQARFSERKRVLAGRWLDQLDITATAVRRRTESGERSSLDHRDLILHLVP